MPTLEPKNVAALLRYRGAGNPPVALPDAAVANCFPGLEFDFRNLWRRIFAGIELHEADNLVVAVDPGAPPAVQAVRGKRLMSVNDVPVVTPVSGPATPGGPVEVLFPATNLEWANALADIALRPGTLVRCAFADLGRDGNPAGPPVLLDLEVRALLDGAAIARDAVRPGELTQSLCSPWQNDYLECGCYYWAASRPDFVNVDADAAPSVGHNWVQRNRTSATPKNYFSTDLLSYEDLFRGWADVLKFVANGNDRE